MFRHIVSFKCNTTKIFTECYTDFRHVVLNFCKDPLRNDKGQIYFFRLFYGQN